MKIEITEKFEMGLIFTLSLSNPDHIKIETTSISDPDSVSDYESGRFLGLSRKKTPLPPPVCLVSTCQSAEEPRRGGDLRQLSIRFLLGFD